jgi:hypothetical protein
LLSQCSDDDDDDDDDNISRRHKLRASLVDRVFGLVDGVSVGSRALRRDQVSILGWPLWPAEVGT